MATKTLGRGAPLPSTTVKLPPYVVLQRRGDGRTAFYFQVPKRLRPDGWSGAYRLPLDHMKRTGAGDAAELAAVTADADTFLRRLKAERSGQPEHYRLYTLPWLIQSFDQKMKTKERAPRTLTGYAYAARQVEAWSQESGHPHVRLITRPAVLQFLSTMDATPIKRRFVASYLRSLMTHAMDKGLRTDNPAIRLGLETPEAKVHIWSDAELQTMLTAADELGLEGVATAMQIAHDEGPRPGDILGFQKHRDFNVRDWTFRYFQNKTGGWVVSPAGRRVRERLAQQPDTQLMLVINPRTMKRYNERVFTRDFDRLRTKTGLTELNFRHLRHTFVVKCKRAGLDEFEIASKTGHSAKSVRDMLARHYLPHDSEVATNATAKIEAYRERKLDAKV
ncbi:MAG TPA: hypothetical protein VGF56_05970 [Rhizomicrobium sp.]|jgi:integrase